MAAPGPGHNYPITSQGSVGGYTQGPMGGQHQPPQFPQASQQPPQMVSPTKSVNLVALCKHGHESIQELVQKFVDMLKLLKQMQLPNGITSQMYQERKNKVEENLRSLSSSMIFRKLRVIYDKVNELSDPEEPPEEVLLPEVGQLVEGKNVNSEGYRYASEEHKQLVEQIRLKNEHIKEVQDKIRTIIWEINTMIVMRKT